MTGKVSIDARLGRPTVLTTSEENEIVAACIMFAEWGFGLGKREVIKLVSDYCLSVKRQNPFHKDVPGKDWWRGFLRRHPQLSDDDDDENENWIQCESCLGWIHQTCGGHPTLNSDQLQALTFLCKTCEDEEIVT